MRRRAKPAKAEVEARRPVARKSPKNEASKRRELEKRLAESLERERAKDRALVESLEQQTVTSSGCGVDSWCPPPGGVDVAYALDMVRTLREALEQMTSEDAARCEQLRISFEGRQAIYIEKGALRVQVNKIAPRPERRFISAEVVEIPTPGLGVGLFPDWQRRKREPLCWRIAAGYLTEFSHDYWEVGYGSWTLFFAPAFIQAVIDLASRFPESLDPWERYNEMVQWVYKHPFDEKPRRVFAGT